MCRIHYCKWCAIDRRMPWSVGNEIWARWQVLHGDEPGYSGWTKYSQRDKNGDWLKSNGAVFRLWSGAEGIWCINMCRLGDLWDGVSSP